MRDKLTNRLLKKVSPSPSTERGAGTGETISFPVSREAAMTRKHSAEAYFIVENEQTAATAMMRQLMKYRRGIDSRLAQ